MDQDDVGGADGGEASPNRRGTGVATGNDGHLKATRCAAAEIGVLGRNGDGDLLDAGCPERRDRPGHYRSPSQLTVLFGDLAASPASVPSRHDQCRDCHDLEKSAGLCCIAA
jgi:hypothetical protein